MSKYVIGGGISGLIFAYYNPEYTIISPDIGGQMTHGMHSMTWIHDTTETRKLLDDLCMTYSFNKTLMGYYYDKTVNDECSSNANIKIITKKMSDWTNLDDDYQVKDNILSVPETHINTLLTDFDDMLKRLSKNVRVVNDYVTGISKDKIYGQNGEYMYDRLVSTMPAKIFWKAWTMDGNAFLEKSPDLKSTPVTFIVSKMKFPWYDNKYEMIYIAEDYYFTRVSNRNREYVYEFTGVMPEDVFKKIYHEDISKYYINKFGRIHTSENKPPQDNIMFLGRFAEWHHSSKIQQVIKKSLINI